MKRICLFIAILAFLFIPIFAISSGTVTQTYTKVTPDVRCLTYSWTGDASDGKVSATPSIVSIDGYIILVITNPGGTAPTTLYDITLTDGDSIDVMGGQLADRSATLTEQVVPKIGTVYGGRWVSGILTLNITNQDVHSATGTVKVFIQR